MSQHQGYYHLTGIAKWHGDEKRQLQHATLQSKTCIYIQSMLYRSPRGLCTLKKIQYACSLLDKASGIFLIRGNMVGG